MKVLILYKLFGTDKEYFIEVFVPENYLNRVQEIIDEYNKNDLNNFDISGILELEDYQYYEMPKEVKPLYDKYCNQFIKSVDLGNEIIDKSVEINLKEYNCKYGELTEEMFMSSLLYKIYSKQYKYFYGEGYTASFNIDDKHCDVYLIDLQKDSEGFLFPDPYVFDGTFVRVDLNYDYNREFYFTDKLSDDTIYSDFIEEINKFRSVYDYSIFFSIKDNILDVMIANCFFVDTDFLDDKSFSKEAMQLKANNIINIVSQLIKIIENYL